MLYGYFKFLKDMKMSLLGIDDLKEQQRINELEQKIRREKAKRDKKITHQKIILGAFLLDMLEKNSVAGLKKFTAENLNEFLTRQSDKDDFAVFIDNLKKDLTSEIEENTSYDAYDVNRNQGDLL